MTARPGMTATLAPEVSPELNTVKVAEEHLLHLLTQSQRDDCHHR